MSEAATSSGGVDKPRGWVRRSAALALAFVLGGLLGLAWISWRRRRRRGRSGRGSALGLASAALFAGILTFGALYRAAVAIASVPPCSIDESPTTYDPGPDLLVNMEKAVTWPVTGLGMAYAQLQHGHRCLVADEGLYFDTHHDSYVGGRSFTVGDVFLSRQRREETVATRLALIYHERHHRRQWALATIIAGPLAFPVAYTVDDFFFPRNRNHFEREAGLESGLYDPATQTGPKLWVQDLALLAAAAAVELVQFARRRRRQPAAEPVPL